LFEADVSRPVKISPIGGPETSVSNHLTLRNKPEDGRIQFNRRRSINRDYKLSPWCEWSILFFFFWGGGGLSQGLLCLWANVLKHPFVPCSEFLQCLDVAWHCLPIDVGVIEISSYKHNTLCDNPDKQN
jgi:hypothetical protein